MAKKQKAKAITDNDPTLRGLEPEPGKLLHLPAAMKLSGLGVAGFRTLRNEGGLKTHLAGGKTFAWSHEIAAAIEAVAAKRDT